MRKYIYVVLLSLVAQASCAEHHEMGEPLGTWEFEHVSNVYSKDSNGQIILQTNWKGSAANYGVVYGTLTLGPNSMDTFKAQIPSRAHWLGQGFLPDGSVAIGDGYGILATKKGSHVWTTDLVIDISDGSKIRSIGEMDLETLTWKGKNYSAD